MKRVLLTGFEPFHGAKMNPSAELIRDVSWLRLGSIEIVTQLLPVDYKSAWPVLSEKIHATKPDLVISLGQASGRKSVSIERIGINWRQEKGADTGAIGEIHSTISEGQKISEESPDGLFATAPIQKMFEAAQATGVPCEISNSAGTFLCNYVFYKTLEQEKFSSRKIAFIHLPLLPEQTDINAGKPTLTLAEMQKALRAIVQAAVSA